MHICGSRCQWRDQVWARGQQSGVQREQVSLHHQAMRYAGVILHICMNMHRMRTFVDLHEIFRACASIVHMVCVFYDVPRFWQRCWLSLDPFLVSEFCVSIMIFTYNNVYIYFTPLLNSSITPEPIMFPSNRPKPQPNPWPNDPAAEPRTVAPLAIQ